MIVSDEVAYDVTGIEQDEEDMPGDDVLLFDFDSPSSDGVRYCFHLRRGMELQDVAEGLRQLADVIERDAE